MITTFTLWSFGGGFPYGERYSVNKLCEGVAGEELWQVQKVVKFYIILTK